MLKTRFPYSDFGGIRFEPIVRTNHLSGWVPKARLSWPRFDNPACANVKQTKKLFVGDEGYGR